MLSVTDFVRKWIISGVRVQAGLHLDMLDADRSPNMQSAFLPELHRWISKLIARHLHACPPGDLLITMVKETVILYKKEFRKMKKKSYLSLTWKRWKREMTARLPVLCQACKRGFTCRLYAYVKKSSPGSTQLPTSRHLLSPPTCATMTHIHTRINRLWSPLAYGLGGNNRLWSPLAYGLGGKKSRTICWPKTAAESSRSADPLEMHAPPRSPVRYSMVTTR